MKHQFRDQFGNPVRAGLHYAVGRSRGTGQLHHVFEDPESGELLMRSIKGNVTQRIYGEDYAYSISPNTVFTLCDTNGCEITGEGGTDDQIDMDFIRQRLAAARHYKDQLDGIENALIAHLHAERDSDLLSTICGCVHGDEPAEHLFKLIEA